MNETQQEPIELPESVIPGKPKRPRPKKSKKPAEVKPQPLKNGIRQPRPGTLCGAAWDLFDELSNKRRKSFSISDALAIAAERKLNPGNVRTEHYGWRKFHGIKA